MEHPAALLTQLEQRARKRFGQHFLTNQDVTRRMIEAAGVVPGSAVLEIGPGLGVLTEALLGAGARLTCIELDRDLAAFLRERHGDRLHLVEGDALRVDLAEALRGPDGHVGSVVANLPYNVGTRLCTRLLDLEPPPQRVVVMLQREVAERMVAPPRTKARGSLSVFVQARAEARVLFRVPPGSFHPPPRVESAVVLLDPHPPALGGVARAHFDAVVRASFSARRKTLTNALGPQFGRDVALRGLDAAGVAPQARAEELAVTDFVRLAGALPAASP